MTSKVSRQSPTAEIIETAKAIENGSDRKTNMERITLQIFECINRLYLEDPRCRFFAHDLQRTGCSFEKISEDRIPLLARRVQKAAKYLGLSIKPSNKLQQIKFEEIALTPDEALQKALQENDLEAVRQRTKELQTIPDEQRLALFELAQKTWDPILLDRILKRWHLPSDAINQLVLTAFERKAFLQIAYPIMLLHFNSLSKKAQELILAWLEEFTGEVYQEMASHLLELEMALKKALGVKGDNFIVIGAANSKENLEPVIARVASLFPASEKGHEDTIMGIAVTGWNFFIEKWADGTAPMTELNECLETIRQVLNGGEEEERPPLKRSSPSYGTFMPFERDVGIPERDEKFDLTEFLNEIHRAIKSNFPDEVKKHLNSKNANQLDSKDFADLVAYGMKNHYHCLGEILTSPHFKMDADPFMGLILEALHQKDWNGLTYLLMSPQFQRIPFDTAAFLIEPFQNADETILALFNNRIASL